jgi:hypothetical protein
MKGQNSCSRKEREVEQLSFEGTEIEGSLFSLTSGKSLYCESVLSPEQEVKFSGTGRIKAITHGRIPGGGWGRVHIIEVETAEIVE